MHYGKKNLLDLSQSKCLAKTWEEEKNNFQIEKLKALGKLSAVFAHEFNSPILGIRNILEEIQEEFATKESVRNLTDIALKECEKLANLVGKLRDIDHSSPGKFEIVDINVLINEILPIFLEEISLKNITLVKNLSPKLPRIHANPSHLKKAFSNLIANAIEAIRGANGTIMIKTEPQGEENILIHLQDNGVGIPEENMSKIFDPFFTTKSAVKGTGLGLTVAFCMVKRHGGSITISNNSELKTSCTIQLPLKGGINE